jgi:hypothetical protein
MTSHFLNPKRKQKSPRLAHFAVATLVLLMAAGDRAGARSGWSERSVESVESRSAGDPIMAIVSLRNQRITVYDANGWILRAPVSSGQRGRETPAGIFAIIQKEAEHYSNLYDDAYMPNMERITWSGIALHGGALPGYPASHGCVRMPFDFAERLFEATPLGMRVIIAPSDPVPVEITHPLLFLSKPGAGALAAIRTAEADDAAKKADQAGRAAGKAFREAAQAMTPVRMAENLKLRAEAELTAAETALGSTLSGEAKEQAEQAKTRAVARIAELQTQLTAARADLQTKRDAVTVARETAVTAENARLAAVEAARQVARELEPVSVLISRKTQRLYVRQAFEPILESPVTILDPDRPIGTHVFTAIERSSGEANLRWSVVSLGGSRPSSGTIEPHGPVRGDHDQPGPMPRDPDNARAALDRIVIPEDVLDRITGIAPRSSLIVTDEALSSETGKGTDFVVLLSGEPQGGIKIRQHGREAQSNYMRSRDRLPYWRSPFGGPFSSW